LLSADIIEAYGGWRKEYLLVKRSAAKEGLKKLEKESFLTMTHISYFLNK
jgi:hypothetical protein